MGFLESGTSVTAGASSITRGQDSRPAGTLRGESPSNHSRFVDPTSTAYVQGDSVIYDIDTNSLFNANFTYTLNFGDGSTPTTVNGGFTATAVHTSANPNTCTILLAT